MQTYATSMHLFNAYAAPMQHLCHIYATPTYATPCNTTQHQCNTYAIPIHLLCNTRATLRNTEETEIWSSKHLTLELIAVYFCHISTTYLWSLELPLVLCNIPSACTCSLMKSLNSLFCLAKCVLYILTCKCASRHSRVPFFDIPTSKSGPTLMRFVHIDLKTCFAPQRRAFL